MSAVKSSPISVSVELEPLSPGEMWLFVITPSMSTLATLLTVTTRMVRINSIGKPPVSRNRIWSGDCLSMLKTSLNPLVPTSLTVTSTFARESGTTRGTGTGNTGPIIKLSWMLSSIGSPRNPLRHGNVQGCAGRLDQFARPDRAVGIAQQPEEQGITQIFGCQQVEPVS